MTMPGTLKTENGEWAYETRPGTERDLLLLHGGGLNLRAWDRVLDHLPGLNAVAVDLPLHGWTSVPTWHWPAVVQDLQRVIERAGLHRPLVVGHSFGGWCAVALASTGAIGGVVSLDGWTGPPWPVRELPPAPPADVSVADADELLDQLVAQTHDTGLPADFVRSIGARSLSQQADRHLLRPEPRQFLAELPEITGFDTAAAVEAARIPMTFVLALEPASDTDEGVDARNHERRDLRSWLARAAPRTRVEWAHGDHNFPLTQPGATAAHIQRALVPLEARVSTC